MTTSTLDRVLAAIDRDRLVRLAVEAVDLYTPTYAEEPATQVFARALTDAGLHPTRHYVPTTSAGRAPIGARANLIARLGPDPIGLLFVGHVDTIQLWPEQKPGATIEDGVLRGLGSCDMKGACAAMVEAMGALVASGVRLRRGVALALVVGEEEYGDGAAALVQTIHAPLAIVGEPSSLAPCLSHWSYLEGRLRARGNRAHAALPEVGESAVHAMLSWVNGIFESVRSVFDAEEMAVSLRSIMGGGRDFVVAESCEADLDVHLAPHVLPSRIRELVSAAREDSLRQHATCELSYTESCWAPGFAIPADDERVAAIAGAFLDIDHAFTPRAFRSHSDASRFHEAGIAPVILGPGDLALAHTRDERIAIDEMNRAAELYAAIAHRICIGS